MSEPNIDKWIDRTFIAFLVVVTTLVASLGVTGMVLIWHEVILK